MSGSPKRQPPSALRRQSSSGASDTEAYGDGGAKAGKRILIVDDEAGMREYLLVALEKEGYTIDTARDGAEGLDKFRNPPAEGGYDLVIGDLKMPKIGGIELLSAIKEIDRDVPVIIMTAFSTWNNAVEAMRLGAYDYLKKPFDNYEIKAVIRRALELAERASSHGGTKGEGVEPATAWIDNFIGNSDKVKEIRKLIRRISPTEATVLIQGESGVGKELVARAVHSYSLRSEQPFIAINCAAFNENLLESELFGHVRGAFTGAISDKKGLFLVADKGSIFLDEVAEMSPQTQVKLLRVLEEKEFLPVGSTTPQKVDVRFITATNTNLEEEVKKEIFREDLFYRLNVICVDIPPLRERKDDIPLLAGFFIARYARAMKKNVKGISKAASAALLNYPWPGNVRELDNTIHRAIALTEGEEIVLDDLVMKFRISSPASRLMEGQISGIEKGRFELPAGGMDLEKHLEEIEKRYILKAMQKSDGNITNAAALLGMTFRSLRYRIKKLGLKYNPA